MKKLIWLSIMFGNILSSSCNLQATKENNSNEIIPLYKYNNKYDTIPNLNVYNNQHIDVKSRNLLSGDAIMPTTSSTASKTSTKTTTTRTSTTTKPTTTTTTTTSTSTSTTTTSSSTPITTSNITEITEIDDEILYGNLFTKQNMIKVLHPFTKNNIYYE